VRRRGEFTTALVGVWCSRSSAAGSRPAAGAPRCFGASAVNAFHRHLLDRRLGVAGRVSWIVLGIHGDGVSSAEIRNGKYQLQSETKGCADSLPAPGVIYDRKWSLLRRTARVHRVAAAGSEGTFAPRWRGIASIATSTASKIERVLLRARRRRISPPSSSAMRRYRRLGARRAARRDPRIGSFRQSPSATIRTPGWSPHLTRLPSGQVTEIERTTRRFATVRLGAWWESTDWSANTTTRCAARGHPFRRSECARADGAGSGRRREPRARARHRPNNNDRSRPAALHLPDVPADSAARSWP